MHNDYFVLIVSTNCHDNCNVVRCFTNLKVKQLLGMVPQLS